MSDQNLSKTRWQFWLQIIIALLPMFLIAVVIALVAIGYTVDHYPK